MSYYSELHTEANALPQPEHGDMPATNPTGASDKNWMSNRYNGQTFIDPACVPAVKYEAIYRMFISRGNNRKYANRLATRWMRRYTLAPLARLWESEQENGE